MHDAVLSRARSAALLLCAAALAGVLAAPDATAQSPLMARISVSTQGDEGELLSYDAALSFDGRWVAFVSFAANLVPGDTNNASDVFVHDRTTGETVRVSVASGGVQADDWSYEPTISADGRLVLFRSSATNLAPGDTNGFDDVFLHDRATGVTQRVSVGPNGEQANLPCVSARLAEGGRCAVYQSFTSTFGLGAEGTQDIFVRDLVHQTTTLASASSAGLPGDHDSWAASPSYDGRYIVYSSQATNLVPYDTNQVFDIFLHDRLTGFTRRLSHTHAGQQANGSSSRPRISANGRYVVYDSSASNLTPGDVNQFTDVFRVDRFTGEVLLVSVSTAGAVGDDTSRRAVISADGRYVVFDSQANTLAPPASLMVEDVYRRDLLLGTTERVPVAWHGQAPNNFSLIATMSGDGHVVAFESHATNLTLGDGNRAQDVYVRVYEP